MSALQVSTDLALGGRWTSLRAGGREWLWRNPAVTEADRAGVRPGSAFVDAGGGEECFPSVTGDASRGHDHGDVWCRPWVGRPGDAAVRSRDGLTLRRRLAEVDGVVRADYEISGASGSRFLHAVHLLLDVSEGATLQVPGRPSVAVQDRPAPGLTTQSTWPAGDGVRLDRLGPDDGTATCAVVAGTAVELLDGEHRLTMRWGAPDGVPTSFMLWRNLRGWPDGARYRSIGIEPMVGAAAGVADAEPDDVAVLGPDGRLTWWLEIGTS